jgi:transcriptional regulator with XRE-family HTH domain
MPNSLKKQVADRIREILKERGLKQQDLVKASGYSKSYISLVLSAHINLTLETVEILARALKTPILKTTEGPTTD